MCLSFLQRGGFCVMSTGPRFVLHKLYLAATPTHDLSHQDMGSGTADTSMMPSKMLTHIHTYKHILNNSKVTDTHSQTQSVGAIKCIGSPLKPWLETLKTNKLCPKKGHFCYPGYIFKSVCYLDVFFYQCFCHCSNVIDFYTPNFTVALTFWIKWIV